MRYTTAQAIVSTSYVTCDYAAFKQLCLDLVAKYNIEQASNWSYFIRTQSLVSVYALSITNVPIEVMENVAACVQHNPEETQQLIKATMDFINALAPDYCSDCCETSSMLMEFACIELDKAKEEYEAGIADMPPTVESYDLSVVLHDLVQAGIIDMPPTVESLQALTHFNLVTIFECFTEYSAFTNNGWVEFELSIPYSWLCDIVRALKSVGYCGANLKVQFLRMSDGSVLPRFQTSYEPTAEIVKANLTPRRHI